MGDTKNDRVRELRRKIGMTQKEFGEKIEVAQTYLSQIENGDRDLTDKIAKIICLQNWNGKTVCESWLKTGEGDMFVQLPEEDEFSVFVSDLLEDGKTNPLYGLIIEIMRTYKQLEPKSQEALCDFSKKLRENLASKEKRED